MELNPSKVSFGRNETFGLRYSWLNKGLKEFKKEEDIFTDVKDHGNHDNFMIMHNVIIRIILIIIDKRL